jgi:ActR/RegA family two-component response regulator
MPTAATPETVLIVDDEEPVRKTFHEWLESADLGCRIVAAADAESALVLANRQPIDLAILDWNLGAGNDGLQLLEDLYLFNPDVVAILVTGYAHQATPLDALRMGVRDYLDKNHDLDRDAFLAAVRRQLERIRPARRERLVHRQLVEFREALDKVLPLVQAAAVLNDPVPLPQAVRGLFRFLLQTTGAADGVLVVRSYDARRQPEEIYRAYDVNGNPVVGGLAPFARSVAGSVTSLGRPSAMSRLDDAAGGNLELQSFERGRRSLLAAPLAVAPGVQVVFELFDKRGPGGEADPGGFGEADHRLVGAAADLAAELLRHALAERQTHRMLLDAVAAARQAGDSAAESLRGAEAGSREKPPDAVVDQLRDSLRATGAAAGDVEDTLSLLEAIRVLSARHGPPAVRHCARLVEGVRELLDAATR